MALKAKNYDPAEMVNAEHDDIRFADVAEIDDENGNEMLEFDTVASAVNYVRLANSATGNNPVVSTQGDDTIIGLQLTPTGTALVLLGNTSTVTIAQGTATINAQRGVITTGAAITSAGTSAAYTFDFVNNKIYTSSVVMLQLTDPSGNGILGLGPVTLGQGSCTVRLVNLDQDTSVTGSVKIMFAVLN